MFIYNFKLLNAVNFIPQITMNYCSLLEPIYNRCRYKQQTVCISSTYPTNARIRSHN